MREPGHHAKTFEPNAAVDVIRDTDVGRPWEPATFVSAVNGMRGWHLVKLSTGEKILVPSRRIRSRK